MSQRKKIRDAFEDPEEWQTVNVSGPSSYALEETGKGLTRSTKRSVTKSSLHSSSELFTIPSLFVATASTPASPYASPRSSLHNIEPQKSPVPPQRSDSFRRSAPNFIPPPPSTPHPSTIRRPSQSPLATSPIGSPKSSSLFVLDEDDDDDLVPNLDPTYRVEILHAIVAADFDSTSALLSRSTSTVSKDNTSLRLLLHPLLPITWRLCGSQRKNNALYCIETALPAVDRLVYIEETWQVINDKNPPKKTFAGKNAILLACSIPSLITSASPLTSVLGVELFF